jgi:hypothetical protein
MAPGSGFDAFAGSRIPYPAQAYRRNGPLSELPFLAWRSRMIRLVLIAAGFLLSFMVLYKTMDAQPPAWEPLGTIHCSVESCNNRDSLIWAHFQAHFDGFKTESALDAWICPEHYQEMVAR